MPARTARGSALRSNPTQFTSPVDRNEDADSGRHWQPAASKRSRCSAKSPNLNAFAEHSVRSVKQECLSKLVPFGAGPLSRVLAEFNALLGIPG